MHKKYFNYTQVQFCVRVFYFEIVVLLLKDLCTSSSIADTLSGADRPDEELELRNRNLNSLFMSENILSVAFMCDVWYRWHTRLYSDILFYLILTLWTCTLYYCVKSNLEVLLKYFLLSKWKPCVSSSEEPFCKKKKNVSFSVETVKFCNFGLAECEYRLHVNQ